MWKHLLLFISVTLLACSSWINHSLAQVGDESQVSAPSASATKDSERNFYEVMDDVLSDFEYDLKNGNVSGLKDLSIRNIAISENIPPSFKSHLDLLITERILKNSKTKVIQCLPCRARKAILNGDQVIVSSPDTNASELARIAKAANIDHFLDASFSYQPTGVVLSMFISDPETGSIIWSRSYNSETSRASAFKRGVDYNQIDEARKKTEYTPIMQYRLALLYLFTPNLPTTSGNLALAFRMMERYDNRKKEVGFEADYMIDASTIVNSTGASASNVYNGFGLNLTLTFVHAWNFIGSEENYNHIRGSFFAALGGTYASGFLGALIRAGYEWRLGKHFGLSAMLGYRPAASAFVSGATTGTISGLEYGVGVNVLF